MKEQFTETVLYREAGANQPAILRAEGDGKGGQESYRASVSSETADVVLRWFDERSADWIEVEQVLLHGEENVDLARFNDNAMILFNHDRDDYVGVMRKAEIVNRRLMVDFDFAARAAAQERKVDVDNGTLRHTSIGALIHDYELREIKDGDKTVSYRMDVTRWEPIEASIVTAPADRTVGINKGVKDALMGRIQRDFQGTGDNPFKRSEKMNPENHDKPADKPNPVIAFGADDVEKANADGIAAERQRMNELDAAADLVVGLDPVARQEAVRAAIRDGKTPSEFIRELGDRAKELKGKPTEPTEADEAKNPLRYLDLSEGDKKTYKLSRLMDGILAGEHDGLEFECARELSKRRGDKKPPTRGGEPSFSIPYDILNDGRRGMLDGRMLSREVNTGNAGELVGTLHKADSFIDTLRDRSVVLGLGAMVLPNLVGSVDIPQKDTNAVYGWVAEGVDGNDTDVTFSTKELRIHTASGGIGYTRRMLKQGTPNIEPIVYNDLITGAALLIDSAAIAGSGVGQIPQGILNTAGINTVTWTAADGFQWKDAVSFATKLAEDNALMNDPAFILTPAFYETMQTTKKDAGSGIFLLGDNGRLNGYRVVRKTGDLGDNILFGDFSQLILGFWEMLELSLDSATKAASGGSIVRAWIDMDVNVRHAVSFVKGSQA